MKIAVLWTRLSGYFNACLRELATRPGVKLFVVHEAAGSDAPFNSGQFSWMTSRFEYASRPDRYALLEQTRHFAPDVLLVSSWHISEFRQVLHRLRPRPLRVLCMDNQWHGTLRQHVGELGARWYVRQLYDAVFVPGERQADFARRLGFADHRIWHGLYCPDTHALAASITEPRTPTPLAFGYLGRLSPEKGIQDLLDAYKTYRASVASPWALRVAGTGPLSSELDRHQAILRSGFVQPADVGAWMRTIRCLVVPSRFEPWGVVIAEGATAGVPIIATSACGAQPHLVHDFANGRVARSGDVRSLASCMVYVAGLSSEERLAMGEISRGLVSAYTPVRWADTVVARSAELLSGGLRR